MSKSVDVFAWKIAAGKVYTSATEAMHRGATLCVDKLKSGLLRTKLVEYAGPQLTEGQYIYI